jgi:DNA invertase Pin-like site-specific DNA recombinase
VSGANAIDARPGFAAMLERIEGNGARTIIVETASRFARDLMVQSATPSYANEASTLSRQTIRVRSSTTRPRPN